MCARVAIGIIQCQMTRDRNNDGKLHTIKSALFSHAKILRWSTLYRVSAVTVPVKSIQQTLNWWAALVPQPIVTDNANGLKTGRLLTDDIHTPHTHSRAHSMFCPLFWVRHQSQSRYQIQRDRIEIEQYGHRTVHIYHWVIHRHCKAFVHRPTKWWLLSYNIAHFFFVVCVIFLCGFEFDVIFRWTTVYSAWLHSLVSSR